MTDSAPARAPASVPAPAPVSVPASGSSRGPWLAFLGCGLIWGSTFLVISIGNDALPPMWAAAWRLGIAAVLLALINRLTGHSLPRGAALRAAIPYGVCQFGINFPLLYWGEKLVPSGLAAVLFATTPLSSAIITRVLGMERLNPVKILGALIAIGGVALIGGAGRGGSHQTLGVLVVITAATVAGLGSVLLKRGPRQPAWGATAVGHAVGLPICLAMSAIAHERWTLPSSGLAWASIGYLTLAGSCGAFALMAWLIQRWPVTRAAFVSVVIPIIALFLGALVRHEPLTGRSLAGAGLVLVGLGCGMAADRGKAGAH